MKQAPKFPQGWHAIAEKIRKRQEREEQVKGQGGNKFQQLEAGLTDTETGKRVEDIVIYGIRTIRTMPEAESFFEGYVVDIKDKPERYPAQAKDDPSGYAKQDIYVALNLHFISPETHRLWRNIIE